MVQEPDDRVHPELAHTRQPLVTPAPVNLVRVIWCKPLPEYRMAQGSDSEGGDPCQVIGPHVVTGPDHLVEPAIADAVDRAFDPAPELQRRARHVAGHATFTRDSRRDTP